MHHSYQTVKAIYTERYEYFDRRKNRLSKLSLWISNLRLVSFAGLILLLIREFWDLDCINPWGITAAGFLFAGFVVLVIFHERIIHSLDRYKELCNINNEAINRLDRNWSILPPVNEPEIYDPLNRAVDLDLFGHASLFQLLGTVNTAYGKTTLAKWLLDSASPSEIRERQAAVKELSPQIDFRQELNLRGRLIGRLPPTSEPFLKWAEGTPWLLGKWWLTGLSRLSCIITLLFMLLIPFGLVHYSLLLGIVLINISITLVFARKPHAIFEKVASHKRELRDYADMLQLLSEKTFKSTKLKDLQSKLLSDGISAYRQINRLEQIIHCAHLHRSEMLYYLIQFITLWDFHVLFFLEKWQKQVGRYARRWLSTLGEMEAISALASLKHDNPTWVFPDVVEDKSKIIKAQGLGHPLLPPNICVTNDVEIDPDRPFLLVTGSNMSGKSTLLRSLGINIVLAQAGGPVFAKAMSLPPIVLATSSRIQDSLEYGVSFFMAELKQLKKIVSLAEGIKNTPERTLLFLFDEILLGTNIFERQIAVQSVLLHLLSLGSIGAVSTHDLTLANAKGLKSICKVVHFTETFSEESEGIKMHFDYKLRNGVAKTVNALKLLEIVGLKVQGDVNNYQVTKNLVQEDEIGRIMGVKD